MNVEKNAAFLENSVREESIMRLLFAPGLRLNLILFRKSNINYMLKIFNKSAKFSISHYWWVALFIASSFGLYAHAAHKKKETISALQTYLQDLKQEKERLLQEKEELLLNIESQNDPAWIELTLMKGLGLVPDGKTKVYFDPSSNIR